MYLQNNQQVRNAVDPVLQSFCNKIRLLEDVLAETPEMQALQSRNLDNNKDLQAELEEKIVKQEVVYVAYKNEDVRKLQT